MVSALSSLRHRSARGHRALRNCLPVVCEPLELRRLLSTAMLVKDINPGTGSGFSGNAEVALGNNLIFAANDGTNGLEPWVSNGTAAGTVMLANINPSGDSDPAAFTLGNGVVYFTANNGTTTQIWQTNGTVAGTSQVTHFSSATGDVPYQLMYSDGTLFFTDYNDDGSASLWATNGTFGAEQDLKNFGQDSNAALIGAYNGRVYLEAGPSQTLWTSNVTTTFALSVTGVDADIQSGSDEGVIFNGQLYFNTTVTNGYQLWTVSGTNAIQVGTTTFSSGESPVDLTESGNTLYFLAGTAATGYQIWSTNGTSITPVTSFAYSDVNGLDDLTDVYGTLYFGFGAGGAKPTLYKLSNGAPTQVPLPSDGSGTDVNSLTDVDGTLFFSGLNATGTVPSALFSSDGNTISAVTGDPGATPVGLTDVDGALFYSSTDPATGSELHLAGPGGSTPPPTSGPTVTVLESTDSINEGSKQKITFSAFVNRGVGESFKWDLRDNGNFTVSTGTKASIKAFFSKTPPGTYPVAVQVLVDGSFVTGETDLDIVNVAPVVVNVKASPKGPKANHLATFTANWTDPGFTDTFTVVWTETNLLTNAVVGTTTQLVGKAHTAKFKNQFFLPGLYRVTAEVTDSFGGSSSDSVSSFPTPTQVSSVERP